MTEFARRKADQLSGGQQQRVALARALVLRPRVLLLDEPLGALDAQLRKNLQVELKALQAELGITFIFVTHDQAEALTMSDRIAVMNKRPRRAGGLAEGDLRGAGDRLRRRLPGCRRTCSPRRRSGQDGAACAVQVGDRTLRAQQGAMDARGEVKVMIRPERIAIEPHSNHGEERMPGMVERSVFLGGAYEVHIRVLGGELLKAMVPNDGGVSAGRPGAGRGGLPAPAARRAARAHPDRAGGTGRGRREHGGGGSGAARRVAADGRRAYWQNTFTHWSGFPSPVSRCCLQGLSPRTLPGSRDRRCRPRGCPGAG